MSDLSMYQHITFEPYFPISLSYGRDTSGAIEVIVFERNTTYLGTIIYIDHDYCHYIIVKTNINKRIMRCA